MNFDLGEKLFILRLLKSLKGHFILLGVLIVIDYAFSNAIGSMTIAGGICVIYGGVISALRYNKFYIEKFIINDSSVRMKVYRFNHLILDIDRSFSFAEIQLDNVKSKSSFVQTDQLLKIKTAEFSFWQTDTNGWTNENLRKLCHILAIMHNSYFINAKYF